jgi:hypothetical protein
MKSNLECQQSRRLLTTALGPENINLGRPLEFHGVHNVTTIERVFCRCRRVSENASFDFAKAHLLRSGPRFIPTHIEMVDHSIGFDGIGSGISKHGVVKREHFIRGRHKSSGLFAITFKNKHHYALGTIDDPAARVGAKGIRKEFSSGRNLAAWIGLVPRQHSTGGKERLGGISKQGNRHLRWLLVAGAMAVIRYARQHGTKRLWLARIMERRPIKVAAVALANKIARMAWAMMVREERFKEPRLLPAA